MLAVGLGDVETFDVGRVASHAVAEEGGVVVEVPVVEGETELTVEALEGGAALGHHRYRGNRRGLDADAEAGQRVGVFALGHAIVDAGEEGECNIGRHRCSRMEEVAP